MSAVFAAVACWQKLLLLLLLLMQLLNQPQLSSAEVRRTSWYIPTRLTARIPCLDERHLKLGRTLDQEHSGSALYRWVQENGNIIGSGFHQTVRLLRMPTNHRNISYVVHLVCMMYNWATEAALTSAHELHFYEGPTLTSAVTLGFRSRQNLTDFVEYLGRAKFTQEWCMKHEQCIQVVVAPVRSPELEYPQLFESATAYNRTPLSDLLSDRRTAAMTGQSKDFQFQVNFVIRLSLSSQLEDLCNPELPKCSHRLLSGREATVMKFSEAAVQLLDSFADERATARKLLTRDQSLIELPSDAMNFSLRLNSLSLCPQGSGPANLTSRTVAQMYKHSGDVLACLACPPGSYGPNGLNCFAVPNDFYTDEWGAMEVTACPDNYVTESPGAKEKSSCLFNGTTPEQYIMWAMSLAWDDIERVFYGMAPQATTFLLLGYVFVTAYALFWQLHRLVALMHYNRRRGMSNRLLKRFITEAYLRDLRRIQYWRAALDMAEVKVNRADAELKGGF